MLKILGISWLHLANVKLLYATGRLEDQVCLRRSLGKSPICLHYGDNEVIYLLHKGGTEILVSLGRHCVVITPKMSSLISNVKRREKWYFYPPIFNTLI